MQEILEQLKRDEAIRLKPYLDCCGKYWRDCTCKIKGKLTIGIGRNLDDEGISTLEAEALCRTDILTHTRQLIAHLDWALILDPIREAVLINMCFNMGIEGLLQFHNTLSLIKDQRYDEAATEMLKSLWAKEVGPRADRLAKQIRTGEWQ